MSNRQETASRLNLVSKLQELIKQEENKEKELLEWAMEYLPHHFTRQFSIFHETLAGEYDKATHKRGVKICVIAPRGNAKTTITLAKTLKAICEDTEHYIMIIMDTALQAKGVLSAIVSELEQNDLLRKHYPIATGKGKVWNADRIETNNNICVEALGTGQKVRGKKFHQYRPTLIIVDDPDNDEDVRSPTVRAAHLEWFNKALLQCGDTETNIFVIGTMIHRECIVAECEKRPDFKTIKFASIIKWPKRMDLWDLWEKLFWESTSVKSNGINAADTRHADTFYEQHQAELEEGAVVLWPQKENLLQLMRLRASSGHAAFQSEKQNDPRDPSKCTFREEWLEETDYEHADLVKLINSNTKRITVVYADPAQGKDTKRGDDSAVITIHYFYGDCCYVEASLSRIPLTEFTDFLLTWHKQVNSDVLGIEAQGFQQLLSEELTRKAQEQQIFNLHVMSIPTDNVNKMTRIDRLSVWLQRKFYRFKKNCPHTEKLKSQLRDHPFAEHDDGSDGLEGCTRLLTLVCTGNGQDPQEDNIPTNIG